MFFFAKTEYKEVSLPFVLVEDKNDWEACAVSIEAYGLVDGQMKYFYAVFGMNEYSMCNDGSYENILDNVRNAQGGEIWLSLKYKKNKLKSFRINRESLAFACGDDRLKYLGLLGWGINDYSIKEKIEAENSRLANESI